MNRFAFIVHPIHPKDAARKYPILKYLPDRVIERLLATRKPVLASKITGIRSITGAETEGWFIACPYTPRQMIGGIPIEKVYDNLVQCTEIAANLGAQIIGLGAFTSVVGDAGATVASRSRIAVTTGNSYTIATAIEGALKACAALEVDRSRAVLAIVGATGSIGRTCAKIMAPDFSKTVLIARDLGRTQELSNEIVRSVATTGVDALREADVVVTVTSSESAIIQPENLRAGAIVCDVARPRDVSVRVAKERDDVLIIEGGVVRVPGDVRFNFSFGFPDKTAYACMSETMMLALEGRIENFTIGRDVSVEQVSEVTRLAKKHGFELAGFRSFERAVDEATIERVRKARRTLSRV